MIVGVVGTRVRFIGCGYVPGRQSTVEALGRWSVGALVVVRGTNERTVCVQEIKNDETKTEMETERDAR